MAIALVGSSGNSAAAINGGSITITFSTGAAASGDIVICAYATTAAATLLATSSAGTAYGAIPGSSQIVTGNLNVNVFQRTLTSSETTVTCSGTGAAADATAGVAFVYRAFSPFTAARMNSTTGTSSRPDSPALTVAHVGDAVLSIVAALSNTAAAVQQPTGYLNIVSTGATDTRSCQIAGSWITSTNNNPLSYDPTLYSSFTSAVWVGFTVTVQSTDPYTPFEMKQSTVTIPSFNLIKEKMIGY